MNWRALQIWTKIRKYYFSSLISKKLFFQFRGECAQILTLFDSKKPLFLIYTKFIRFEANVYFLSIEKSSQRFCQTLSPTSNLRISWCQICRSYIGRQFFRVKSWMRATHPTDVWFSMILITSGQNSSQVDHRMGQIRGRCVHISSGS